MSTSILIVEDDTALGSDVAQVLTAAGHTTRHVLSVPDARRAWSNARSDLCLVDILMPGPSGKVFCREVRERSDAAIIVMSSLSDEETVIALLDIGADDYLIKPFSMREMQARIRAVLRRRGQERCGGAAAHATSQIGEWTFDLQLRRLSKPDGMTVPLTQSEASVLRFMSQSPGITFSREDLLAVARSRQHSGKDDRAVDTLIKRLRRKVEVNPTDPKHIVTEWGKGYRFEL